MLVYIVEDDPGVSDSLRLLLQTLGHGVRIFADAESFLAGDPPQHGDAVIIDLALPGIGGADAVRRLLDLPTPPKVICISGQAQSLIDEALRGLDPPHILRKPLLGDLLVSLL